MGLREQRPFIDMSSAGEETGLLWAINRYLFHPRGFALTFHFDDDGQLTGWSLQGDGKSEVWAYDGESDDDGFLKFERYLASLRRES
jgi:hypothetical protein